MSTTNSTVGKPLTVKYPFVTASGQDYRDLDTLLNDLGAQSGGYYLLGANNYWHGGIHITDEKFAQHKKDHPVRCMMDGEVIAYRLNLQYPTQSWQVNSQLPAKDIRYSNGFCLVRHKYTSQSNQEEGAQNGETNQLTFYSLYMHLADYKTYTADAVSEPKMVAITKDVRAREPGHLSHSLGVLKHGSQILVDPAQTPLPFGSNQYYQVTIKTPAAGSGATLTAETPVYLYAGCFPDGTFSATEKPKLPVYWKGTVTAYSKEPMKVYDTKENCIQRTVEPIARLNERQTFTFQLDKAIRNVMIKGVSHSIAECQYPTSATFGYEPCSSGWMIVDESQVIWDKLEPTEFDSIVKFSEPLPIFAGDPIGLMGVWESPKAPYTNNDIQSKMLMHMELFAADDKSALGKFLSNEAGLKTGKKYLKVPKGSKLYSSDGDGSFVHPHELLSAARDYVFEESACTQVKDTAGTVFYNLKGIRNGEGATGPIDFAHVKIEGEVKLVTQHDWNELGFTSIEEINDNSDGYVDPDKIASPLFQDIFKKIDSSHDGMISGEEIKNALQRDKELRNDLFKMIAGHPSEWHRITQTNMKTKFDELNAQNTDENYKKANQLELDKFLKFEFVSQVDGLTQKFWHFHPVIATGVLKNNDWFDISMFISKYKLQHHDSNKFGAYDRNVKINIPQLNNASEENLKNPLHEMKKQYSNYFVTFNAKYVAYMLSTIRVESYSYWTRSPEFFKPVAENISYEKAERNYGCGDDASIVNRQRAIANGNSVVGDGYKYRGRGLVQLTWRNSYERWSNELNADFINQPDLIMDLTYSVSIMMKGMSEGLFRSGHCLARYLGDDKRDYYNARLIINGYRDGRPDKTEQFTDFAEHFESIIKECM